MTDRAAAYGLVLASCLVPSLAIADGGDGRAGDGRHARAVLTLGSCDGVDESEVRRILPIELDTPLAEADDATTFEVRVECDGARARVRVTRAGRSLDRSVDLISTPDASRPRVLALAIAELVAVEDAEPRPRAAGAAAAPLPTAPDTRPAPKHRDAPTRPTDAPETGPRVRETWTVEGFVHERSALTSALSAWGGGARVTRAWPSEVDAAVDVRADHGTVGLSLGSVGITHASLGVSIGVRTRAGDITLRGAVSARAGLSELRGDPSDPARTRGGSFLAAWAGPGVELGGDALLASALVVGLAGEAGVDLVPARGLVNGASAVSGGGAWVGARLSLGARF